MSDSSPSEPESVDHSQDSPWHQPPRSGASGENGIRGPATVLEAIDTSYDDIAERPSAKLPGKGGNDLTVLWEPAYGDASTPGHRAVMTPDFDIVVIPGLHGTRSPPWKNPGSGDSGWLDPVAKLEGRRVMSFGYDATNILAGDRTRQVIRKAAVELLKGLVAERRKLGDTRSIMFIAHDLGGVILKDALIVAGLHPMKYGGIFNYTRALVFYGCPHRARSYMDMEDRLSRFTFSHARHSDKTTIAAAVSSIRGLSRAVIDINNLFLDSKHVHRSYPVSIYAGKRGSSIDLGFDSYAATLGVPFEMRFAEQDSGPSVHTFIEAFLVKIQLQLVPDPATLAHERTLLCVAAPAPLLATADEPDHPFAWVGHNEVYKSWFNQKKPQLLYLHGTSGVQDASEFVFYDLDRMHSKRNNDIVLYFKFNSWDNRRNTIGDMLSYFLAQIIGHFPSLTEFVQDQFERLNLDRSWADFDLLNWFEYYRLRGEAESISCVIANFDECPLPSRRAFLGLFSYIAGIHERPWRLAITSKVRGALSDELSGFEWPTIDMDTMLQPPSTIATADFADRRPEVHDIVASRPERRGFLDLLEEELGTIDDVDPTTKHLVIQYMSAQPNWPERQTIKSTLGDVEDNVEDMLGRIMCRIPDQPFALRALSWIVHCTRPPTVWEMACVMLPPDGENAFPHPDFVLDVMNKLTTWLGGLLTIEQSELHIPSGRVRDILTKKPAAGTQSRYAWEQFARTGHAEIAKTCLAYLMRDDVQQHLAKTYTGSDVMDLPTHPDRTNLCDYATQYWMHHLSLVPAGAGQDPAADLKTFMTSDAVPLWSKAYWAAANPIRRSPAYFETVYPLLAGVGLAAEAEPWRKGEDDNNGGLVEAYLNGRRSVAEDLLRRFDHSAKAFQEALIAAGSHGDETVWLDLIEFVQAKHGTDFPWPLSLVNRAAWLGQERVVSRLLELGVPVDPEDSIQMDTPLHLVSRTGHSKVVKILLDHGANVHHRAKYGKTALHVAASFGHSNCARLLGEAGIDLNAKGEQHMTAIYVASLWGNFSVIRALLALGADPNISDNDHLKEPGWYPLTVAAEEKNVECARALLAGGADPNVYGNGGTPLRYAAVNGLTALCKLLLEKGADPNHVAITPPILTQIVNARDIDNKLEIAKLLVKNRAHIDQEDADGSTPLWWASYSDDERVLPIIFCLIDWGADLSKANRSGVTPLLVAARRNNLAAVRLLLSKGADPNYCATPSQLVSLSYVVQNADMVRLLLDSGADPNRHPPSQDSPLMWAVMNDCIASARLLLQRGASLEPVSAAGLTALGSAVSWGSAEMVRLLGDAGADVNYRMPATGRGLVHLAFSRRTAASTTPVLAALLEFRPDVNRTDVAGELPLHLIGPPTSTPLESVQLLVRAGADIRRRNARGLTPLVCAARERHGEAVRYLVTRGADVNAAGRTDGTALHLACQHGMLDLVRDLIAAGADVNFAVAGAAGTPLMSALLGYDSLPAIITWEEHMSPDGDTQLFSPMSARQSENDDKQAEIAALLVEKGARASVQGGQLASAASVAAWKAPVRILRWVLDHGASATAADSMGRQAVHIAALRGAAHLRVVLDAGGKAVARDVAGRTPLHWAAQGAHRDAVELVVGLAGDEAVNQPDVAGWTPLCWAARAVRAEGQLAVVSELLRRGADKLTAGKLAGGREATPWDIASYHSASEAVLALLATNESMKTRADARANATSNLHEHDARRNEKHVRHIRERQLTTWLGQTCNYCLDIPQGLRYKCGTCDNFDLCYKCYEVREDLHPADHVFDEVGPEFYTVSEALDSSSFRSSESISDEESTADSEELDDN